MMDQAFSNQCYRTVNRSGQFDSVRLCFSFDFTCELMKRAELRIGPVKLDLARAPFDHGYIMYKPEPKLEIDFMFEPNLGSAPQTLTRP